MEQENLQAAEPADKPALPGGWLEITSIDLDAQGVARKPDGKVVFIDGALPTEIVSATTTRRKNQTAPRRVVLSRRLSAKDAPTAEAMMITM